MDRNTHRRLIRLLHGELPASEARVLRDRLRREPELQVAYDRLQRQWEGLDLPATAPVPLGFVARVMAGAEVTADQRLSTVWWGSTLSGRLATATLLVGGMVLGALLARVGDNDDWTGLAIAAPTLAESYWTLVDQSSESLTGGESP